MFSFSPNLNSQISVARSFKESWSTSTKSDDFRKISTIYCFLIKVILRMVLLNTSKESKSSTELVLACTLAFVSLLKFTRLLSPKVSPLNNVLIISYCLSSSSNVSIAIGISSSTSTSPCRITQKQSFLFRFSIITESASLNPMVSFQMTVRQSISLSLDLSSLKQWNSRSSSRMQEILWMISRLLLLLLMSQTRDCTCQFLMSETKGGQGVLQELEWVLGTRESFIPIEFQEIILWKKGYQDIIVRIIKERGSFLFE